MWANTTFIEMYGCHWTKKSLLLNEGFDNSVHKVRCSSVNSQWRSKTLALWVLAFCCMVQRVWAADNIAINFVGEWGFHINYWNVISQVKQKWADWKKYWRAWHMILNQCQLMPKRDVSQLSCIPDFRPKCDQKGLAYTWVFLAKTQQSLTTKIGSYENGAQREKNIFSLLTDFHKHLQQYINTFLLAPLYRA